MGQKSNSISLRLESTNRNFDNIWFSDYGYTSLLLKDILLQHYFHLFCKLLKIPKSRASIRYGPKKTILYLFMCYPTSSRDLSSKFFGIFSRSQTRYIQQAPHIPQKKEIFKKNWSSPHSPSFVEPGPKKTLFARKIASLFQKLKSQDLYKKQGLIPTLQEKKSMYEILPKTGISKKNNLGVHSLLLQKDSLQSKKTPILDPPGDFKGQKKSWVSSLLFSSLKREKLQKINVLQTRHQKSLQVVHAPERDQGLALQKESSCNCKKESSFCTKTLFCNRKASGSFQKLKKNVNSFSIAPPFQNTLSFLKYLLFLSHFQPVFFNVVAKKPAQSLVFSFLKSQAKEKLFLVKTLQGSLKIQTEKTQPTKRAQVCTLKKTPLERLVDHLVTFQKHQKQICFLEYFKRDTRNLFFEIQEKDISAPQFFSLTSKYQKYFEYYLSSAFQTNLELVPFLIQNEWQNAGFLADEIVYFLEKRVAFRRIKITLAKQLSLIPALQGARIVCSGRVGGKSKKAQRAKIESMKYGQTCLQVFSSQIDFATRTASTPFGSVGVKVWMSYK